MTPLTRARLEKAQALLGNPNVILALILLQILTIVWLVMSIGGWWQLLAIPVAGLAVIDIWRVISLLWR